MKSLLTIIIINFIFSQGNYQILSTPSNFETFFKINNLNQNQNYSVFNISFPSDINLFSIKLSNSLFKHQNKYDFTITNLNYGDLSDFQNDYQFTANESTIKFGLYKNINRLSMLFNLGYVRSNIDVYQAEAIYIDFDLFMPLFKHHNLGLSFKNFGIELNSYLSASTQLPETIRLSYILDSLPIPIIIYTVYENRIDYNNEVLFLTLQLDINKNVNLYFSNRSDRANLFSGDYIDKLISGMSTGISYKNSSHNFSLGIQNLGASGYSTAINFSKIIL